MMNENETKELSFGAEANSTPVSSQENTTPTPAEPVAPSTPEVAPTPATPEGGNGGGGNSFYDRQQDKASATTVWYKDWRGKTLGLTLAAAILIGGGIPAGMAMAGYWRETDFGNELDRTEQNNAFDIASDEVERIYDKAVRQHFDELVYEGYITEASHDRKIEDAEDAADNTIDTEKNAIKDQYGNTWEEEWDKSLKEKGFHTAANGGEDEYRESMIADSIVADVKSQYNTKSALTSTAVDEDGSGLAYDYQSSGPNSKGKYYFIENEVPLVREGLVGSPSAVVDENDNIVTSYTPEDLVHMYLATYQPIVFNNSLLPFVPVSGANDTEANIQGDNIYMTNDNVKSAWSFANAEAAGGGAPAATNYGGIQSAYNISFAGQSLGEEADIAVNLLLAGGVTGGATNNIEAIVNAGFAAAGITGTVTSTTIQNMNSQDVQAFSEGVAEALKADGLLTGDDGTHRSFGVKNVYTGSNSVSFVSTNGLNNIGVQLEGEEVVIEQLDSYAEQKDAINVDFVTSFNSWFEKAFKYITILDYFTTPINVHDGWFDASGNLAVTLEPSYDDEGNVTGTKIEEIGTVIDNEDILAITGADKVDETSKAQAEAIVKAYFPLALFENVAFNAKTVISDTYNAGKTFVETNWEDYDSTDWATGAGKTILTYQSEANLNLLSDAYFTAALEIISATKEIKDRNEVVFYKGGDQ